MQEIASVEELHDCWVMHIVIDASSKLFAYADQPLPSELNMSQLLSILYEQGVAHGQTFISLFMRHSSRTADGTTDESRIGRSGLGW